ncbi:MAG TPA: IS66 family transposase [Gemmataceae bacterium]|jgi:transposase|nr:IS66 family transposase [Gemmataceae bacterium]
MDAGCPGCVALGRRVAELEAAVARLTRDLEEAIRASKRQAAPFSKGPPKSKPKKPGRKPGEDYGTKAHRQPPPPENIGEVYEAPLPDGCPDCGGAIDETEVRQQFQTEIIRQALHRQFNVHIGTCRACQKRVQGRHPLQTSDALGAAAAQLGPDAQAAAVELNKNAGLSHGKVVRCLENLFGISLSRGGSAQIILRVAQRCEPVYATIRTCVRSAPWVVPDETGWHVAGDLAWLHGFVTPDATAYVIDSTRGGAVSEALLGRDYAGIMIHDGWSPYNQFANAAHQQCLRHFLNRCDQMHGTATRGSVRFPRAIGRILRQALKLRDRSVAGAVSDHGLKVARGHLERDFFDAILGRKIDPANERFAQHLRNHCGEIFTFLDHPGLDATNWRAELAMRFGVILRKVWGGNRTWAGARAQSVLMSVWRTCWQRGRLALDFVSQFLRNGAIPLPLPP